MTEQTRNQPNGSTESKADFVKAISKELKKHWAITITLMVVVIAGGVYAIYVSRFFVDMAKNVAESQDVRIRTLEVEVQTLKKQVADEQQKVEQGRLRENDAVRILSAHEIVFGFIVTTIGQELTSIPDARMKTNLTDVKNIAEKVWNLRKKPELWFDVKSVNLAKCEIHASNPQGFSECILQCIRETG
jgi:hypothetical protein